MRLLRAPSVILALCLASPAVAGYRHSGIGIAWHVGLGDHAAVSVYSGYSGYPGSRYPYRYRAPYWRGHDGHYDRWRYRWRGPVVVQPVPRRAMTPPRTLRQEQLARHSRAHLPANARVLRRNDQILYRWQGQCYRFDWNSKRYHSRTCGVSKP